MDYDILKRDELKKALIEVSMEYSRLSDEDQDKVITVISNSINSKATLKMMLPKAIMYAIKKGKRKPHNAQDAIL